MSSNSPGSSGQYHSLMQVRFAPGKIVGLVTEKLFKCHFLYARCVFGTISAMVGL